MCQQKINFFYISLHQVGKKDTRIRNNAPFNFHETLQNRINLGKRYRKSKDESKVLKWIHENRIGVPIEFFIVPLRQLIGLGVYMYMTYLNTKDLDLYKCSKFPLDMTTKIFAALRANDWWRVKMLMAPGRSSVEDFSLLFHIKWRKPTLYSRTSRTCCRLWLLAAWSKWNRLAPSPFAPSSTAGVAAWRTSSSSGVAPRARTTQNIQIWTSFVPRRARSSVLKSTTPRSTLSIPHDFDWSHWLTGYVYSFNLVCIVFYILSKNVQE